jgi:hypothetical protein
MNPMSAGHGEKFGRKLEKAIAALLSETTVEAAAAKVAVAYSTLRGWMRDPEFQEAYRQARAEILERTVARLLVLSGKALDALERNLTCGQPAAENRAAELILEPSEKGHESLDLAWQLAELRAELEATQHGHSNHPPPVGADPGADSAAGGWLEPGPGPLSPGPGGDPAGCGDGAQSVASGTAPLPGVPNAPPLFPASGQESDGRRPGPAGGPA